MIFNNLKEKLKNLRKQVIEEVETSCLPRECRRRTCNGCDIYAEIIKFHPRGNTGDIIIIDGIAHMITETRSGLVFGTVRVQAENVNNEVLDSPINLVKKL